MNSLELYLTIGKKLLAARSRQILGKGTDTVLWMPLVIPWRA